MPAISRSQQRAMVLHRLAMQQQMPRRRGVALSPMDGERLIRRAEQDQARRRRQAGSFEERMRRAAESERAKSGGGEDSGGFFGNSIIKGIMTPIEAGLNTLDIGRRVVLSGLKEGADWVGEVTGEGPGTRLFGTETDESSWSDFMQQVRDPTFGFGDIVGDATGNRWLDRAIGFGGDVLFDPTTYLTLGSARAIGTGGRMALAGEAASKGLGEEAVSRIARLGEAALTPVEREALGVKAGLRFGVPSASVRIPGTGRLATGGQQVINRVRAPFTDTVIGRGARRLGGSRVKATREFTERLATGRGDVSALDAANVLAARRAEQSMTNMTKGRMARRINRTAKQLEGRGDITRAIERGLSTPEGDELASINRTILDLQREAGVAVSPRANYVPHYLTDDFAAFLNKVPDSGFSRTGPGSGTGRLDARTFTPDTDITVNGKKIHLDTADIDDIEAKFQAAFPEELGGKKLIEDDPSVWLPRLLLDASGDIGTRTFERRLMAGGSLVSQVDKERLRDMGFLKTTDVSDAEAKAAAKKFREQQRANVEPLLQQRALMGEAVERKTAQAVSGAALDLNDAVARAGRVRGEAEARLGQAGRVADYARGEMDRLATEGDAALRGIEDRLAQLDEAEAALRAEATAERGRMNRARAAGFRQRMADIRAERAQLQEQVMIGRLAAQERDPVRKQLGRATARQRELAARVGEGPLGAERVAAGETLPQQAEVAYQGRVQRGLEARADQLEALAQAQERRASSDVQAELAGQLGGRPVATPEELSRQVQRLGGATPEGREAALAERIDTGVTKKGSHALTDADRRAGRRKLKPEELAEPNVLSDAVTNANDPDVVQAFYDTQVALTDALRPYRASNLEGAVPEPHVPLASKELNAKRQQLVSDIETHEKAILEARRRARNGLSDPAEMETLARRWTAKRNKLMRELDTLRTVSMPRGVSAMDDLNVIELTDRAARLADFMVRYAYGAAQPGADLDAVAARAAREALRSEHDEIVLRLRSRLRAERGAQAEDLKYRFGETPGTGVETRTDVRFDDPEELEAEVERRWQAEAANRRAEDDRLLREAQEQEAAQREAWQSERAKPERAQAALDASQAELTEARRVARDTRNAAERGRRKGMTPGRQAELRDEAARARAEVKRLEGVVEDRTADLGSARSQWKLYSRDVGEPKPVELALPERETEAAFRNRVRTSLAEATTTKAIPQASADRATAAAYELESLVRELAAPVREADRNLTRFERLVEKGRVNPGQVRDLLEDVDVDELVQAGRAGVDDIRGQLQVRLRESQDEFASSVSALVGKRLKYNQATRLVRGNARESAERMLGEMAPQARASFDTHLKWRSMVDQRRLRDVDARMARMGEGTGGQVVTDKPYFALLEPASALRDEATALAPVDLSRLTTPEQLSDIEAQRALIGQAREQLSGEVVQARSQLLPKELPEMQRLGFENELQTIAAGNAAERAANAQRVGQLSESQSALLADELAGREARAQLGARGTFDEEMQRRLEQELAPMRGRIEATEGQIGDVGEARTALETGWQQVDEQTRNQLSSVTSMYDAARAAQMEAAVDVAQTEQLVANATAHLERVKKLPKPKLSTKTRGKGIVPITPATSYQQAVEQVRAAIESGAPPEVVKLLDDAASIAADMVKVDTSLDQANRVLQAAKDPKFLQMTKEVIAPGVVEFSSKTAGETFLIREELNRALLNMRETLYAEPSALGKMFDRYTQFFKAYATATPGFHVRNAISATFMNGADGVTIKNMTGGMRIWGAWMKYGATEPDTWMKRIRDPRLREVADAVVKAVYGSGAGGQFSAAELGQRAFGGRHGRINRIVNENKWLKGSQRAGEAVEGAVRAGMALDSLARGEGIGPAIARINRIHFNYSDVGEMDAVMRRLVPFWTFMSRNVPLQLQQMVLQPRAYQHYRSFVRNFSDPESDQSALPEWMRAAGGFRVTPGMALTPQVGLTNLSNDLEQLTNPTRMLSAANPLIKAPLSVMTNRNFFQDYEYGDRMERLEGINSLLGPALGLAGVSEDLPGGGQAAPQAWVEAGRDLLPPLRLLARLTGSGDRYEGAGKQQTAALSLLGVPLRRFNAEDAFNEAERRANERYYDQLAEAERREMLAHL